MNKHMSEQAGSKTTDGKEFESLLARLGSEPVNGKQTARDLWIDDNYDRISMEADFDQIARENLGQDCDDLCEEIVEREWVKHVAKTHGFVYIPGRTWS